MTSYFRLAVLSAIIVCTQGFMVMAPVNQCKIKEGEIRLAVVSRSDCSKMGGTYQKLPYSSTDPRTMIVYGLYQQLLKITYYCTVDMCEVPDEGTVTDTAAWTIRAGGIEPCRGLDDPTQAAAYIPMTREGCDAFVGGKHTADWISPFSSSTVMCDLCMRRMNGTDKNSIDGVVFCGKNHCHQKKADVFPEIGQQECLSMGGKVSHDEDFDLLSMCSLDVGLFVHCIPTDFWSEIQTCSNVNSSRDLTCSYEKTIGMEVGESEESTTGGSVSSTITAEVGVTLKKIFTAKASTSFTTGFNWQKTTGKCRMWSQSTTQTLTVKVPPGETVTVSQVVGVCNQFQVRTTEFRVTSRSAVSPQSYFLNRWMLALNLVLLYNVVHYI